jgi:hypothetical protein
LTPGWRLLLAPRTAGVIGVVLDDASERGGSENRHDDVRESGSQDSHSQVVASEWGRPWSPRGEDVGERTPARVGSAAAVLRRVVEDSVTSGADRAVTDVVIIIQSSSATISAHKNPASSRAMAAAPTERTFLWAASGGSGRRGGPGPPTNALRWRR